MSVDEQRGILWRGSLTSMDSEHYERVDTLTNEWEEHQHQRPSPLRLKDQHSHAAPPRENETLRHHFAKDVVNWTAKKLREHDIEELNLFAPPRFLGELRKVWPNRLRDRLAEHEGDLGYMGAGELKKHPVVSKIVRSGAKSTPRG